MLTDKEIKLVDLIDDVSELLNDIITDALEESGDEYDAHEHQSLNQNLLNVQTTILANSAARLYDGKYLLAGTKQHE